MKIASMIVQAVTGPIIPTSLLGIISSGMSMAVSGIACSALARFAAGVNPDPLTRTTPDLLHGP